MKKILLLMVLAVALTAYAQEPPWDIDQDSIPVAQDSIVVAQDSIVVAQDSIVVAQDSIPVQVADAGEAKAQIADINIDSLKTAIVNGHAEINGLKENGKVPVSDVKRLASEYALLARYYENKYNQLDTERKAICAKVREYEAIDVLLTPDTTAFSLTLPSPEQVPPALKAHYDRIIEVKGLKTEIGNVWREADNSENLNRSEGVDPKDGISAKLFPAVDEIKDKVLELIDSGLPTFSDIQRAYVEGLESECDKFFIKYSDNE